VFVDRVLRAEHEAMVAAAWASVLEKMGDVPGAIAELKQAVDVYARYGDLVASGALDPAGMADLQSWLGTLYLEQRELGEARAVLTAARRRLGDTSGLLFLLSELERKSGNAAAALALYQRALALRKEAASEVTVAFGTNRQARPGRESADFGGDPGDRLSVGQAVVLVPGAQFSTGAWLATPAPAAFPVGRATNPDRLIIRTRKAMTEPDFRAASRAAIGAARLYPRSALVFVHGYNVTFDQALQRGAQLVRDLNYDGPAFVFSWPSRGDWWKYGTDRGSADQAAERLAAFLGIVEAVTGAETIHVIAHSMGNRVLFPALARIARDDKNPVRSKLGEIVLAAPAVPLVEFVAWIDELSRRGLSRFTLYASAVDRAMQAGFLREGGMVLAGSVSGGEPWVHPHVHSIDVSEAGATGLISLNHDVFASNPVMTEDMRQLLQRGQRPPSARVPALEPRASRSQPGTYWYYRAPAAAAP
jgi:esterase/lipase superfamily enzyme